MNDKIMKVHNVKILNFKYILNHFLNIIKLYNLNTKKILIFKWIWNHQKRNNALYVNKNVI